MKNTVIFETLDAQFNRGLLIRERQDGDVLLEVYDNIEEEFLPIIISAKEAKRLAVVLHGQFSDVDKENSSGNYF